MGSYFPEGRGKPRGSWAIGGTPSPFFRIEREGGGMKNEGGAPPIGSFSDKEPIKKEPGGY